MKLIDNLNLHALRNNEHYQFMTDVENLIKEATSEILGITTQHSTFANALNALDTSLRVEKGSSKSAKVHELDKLRDKTWRAIKKRVDAVNELDCKVWLNTECGHSYYTMWNGLNHFGMEADFKLESLITYYARWIREGKLPVNSRWNTKNIAFTVQDPCMIVRKAYGESIAEDMRFVVKSLVGEENFIDMQPNRSANYCCGGGGGFLQAGMTGHRRTYGKRKFDQIAATGAAYVLTPCHNCHSQMEDIGHHYGGSYGVVHFWTLICLSLGILGENERTYLGPDLLALID